MSTVSLVVAKYIMTALLLRHRWAMSPTANVIRWIVKTSDFQNIDAMVTLKSTYFVICGSIQLFKRESPAPSIHPYGKCNLLIGLC